MEDKHEAGTDNRHSKSAKRHIENYKNNYKNRSGISFVLIGRKKPEKFFKKINDHGHMHSRNRKNVAHSAFSESFGNFVFKFASGPDKYLFGERCFPIREKFINHRRNFFTDKVYVKPERRIFFPDNFDWRICVSINFYFSGAVFKNLAEIVGIVNGKSYVAGNFIIRFCKVFVPTGNKNCDFLRRSFNIHRIGFDFKNRVSTFCRNFGNCSGNFRGSSVKGKRRIKPEKDVCGNKTETYCRRSNKSGNSIIFFAEKKKAKAS